MLALNLGAGPLKLEGEIGVDLHPTGGCEVQADLRALPFRNESADQVRMDHVLEHLPYRMGLAAVIEAARVLRPGGRMIVGVPNLTDYCRVWIEAGNDLQLKAELMRGIYGGQSHPGEYHQAAFDPEILRDLLETVGLVDVTIGVDDGVWRTEGFCLRADATKPGASE